MKLVSVVIPCYNYGWLLPETLDSLLAQTYPHWECLIVDDGSTDTSKAVAEEYQQRDARFCYVYQANAGMSAARNHGLRLACGEYLQFLDADDLLAPRKLETQVAFLEAHPTVDLVYGDMRYFQHGSPQVLSRSGDMLDQRWMAEVHGQGEAMVNVLVEKSIMVVNAPLLRATLAKRVGPFSEDLRSVEDWEFWIRCALAGARFHYDNTPDAWAIVRVHPTSTSQNLLRMHTSEVAMRRRLATTLAAAGAQVASRINAAAINDNQFYVAMYNMKNGSILTGIKGYVRLAYTTKRYGYYLKSIPYWLKHRLFGAAAQPQ
ncbi:glycosyltransferase family 2 protein [Hymenobacter volaticus]|uniref:Glycosyltransferase n=1 Tax=Hymenobacter volaticus TaxID=2932254 RepID=A0ABY4G8P1_9BACT|nr:glycosyltransferase [Hymenobacter volaticus]UOQ67217.1 glycosyltransferase [Hymenobacter volaticus]